MKALVLVQGFLALATVPALGDPAAWRKIPFSEPEAVHGLCARGDTLWAAVDGGVRVSANDGAAWSETGSGFGPGKVAGIAAGRRHLAACQGRMVFLSADGGRTWLPGDSIEVGEFSRMDYWDDTLFAWHSLFGSSIPRAIRFSIDDGLSWNPLAIDGPLLPHSRVFASDTLSFANGTIYRVNSDGPKEMHSFAGHILDLAPTGKRLFALTDNLIYAASDPKGPWTHIPTRSAPASHILGLAADSDGIAILTTMGVSLSRDRGRNWEFLMSHVPQPSWQTLRLSKSDLYVLRVPYDPVPRRYSLAGKTWDSLELPSTLPFSSPVLAVHGDRVAWLAQFGPTGDSIFISRGQGEGFKFAGLAPLRPASSANLLLGRDSAMVFLAPGTMRYSRNDGAAWQPAAAGACNPGTNPYFAALGDSGVFFLGDAGLSRIRPEAGTCERTAIPAPDGKGGLSPKLTVPVSGIAAAGGSLYLVMENSLWVWEETAGTPIVAKPRAYPRAALKSRFPVRVWARPAGPGPGAATDRVDARGALRR